MGVSIRGDKETVNVIQKIEHLLREGRDCVIWCLNEELNKKHPVVPFVRHYEQLLADFNAVLKEPSDD